MRLFTSSVEVETPPLLLPASGPRKWRWVFDVELRSIGLRQEVLFAERGSTWQSATRYASLDLTKHFGLGRHHDYYDGPHDSFSLGFLHLNWSWNWCKKCYPEKT